jgi:poly-gamma-glutamate synthesis protein (capsule biosynthesis protein)
MPRKFIFLVIVLSLFLSGCKSGKTLNSPVGSQTLSTPNVDHTFTLVSTGDIGLVRYINLVIQQKKDPTYPFLNIASYLKDADITITNLEGPLIKNCPIFITGFKFCGEATNVKGLIFAGIDATNLANNHITNFGLEGLGETANILQQNGITGFGQSGQIDYLTIKGKKIALVGFVELGANWGGLNNATEENVAKLVAQAKKNAGIVITAFHWGTEYQTHPTDNQIKLAHIAVDNGADLVLGNHPHWIQDSEIYKGKFITYAQGNTIFDQDWSQETKEGVLYKFKYENRKFKKIDEKYTVIDYNVQPRFATEQETSRIKKRLNIP